MKSEYRVVVIGGGVVGASVLYHLAKFGWSDVALIERSVLTAGSSWHAAGGFHALNADPNIASLQAYTIDLLSEIEKESGQSVGMHMTGGLVLAGTPDRWEWLQSAYRTFQSIGIEDVRLVTPKEAGELCPVLSTDGIIGGMWADREGYIDTTGTVHAYAGAAKKNGATVIEHNRVLELHQRPGGGWDVVTEKGTIKCEHVVNAAGLWAKQVGRMAGIELPVSPLSHHYLLTETIPEIAALDEEIPMVVDLEGFTYMRQDLKGMLLGIYEINHQHWMMDGAPWDYGIELLQEDIDRIENELRLGFERFPVLQKVGVRNWVNGAFTFSPDGNPLVGPVRGKPGYWCACAVMAGFLQGGGVGKSLAEWIIHGEPESDVFGMDVARYGPYAENKQFIKPTTGQFYTRRFVMTYPNEQLPAGRPLKMAPAYSEMTEAGCRWGRAGGWSCRSISRRRTLSRSRRSNAPTHTHWWPRNAGRARRRRPSGHHRLLALRGVGAKRGKLARPADGLQTLPGPGRARLAPMLSPEGKLKGDLTVFNWGDGTWWIMGSYYLREWHMRWFHDHMADGVTVRDLGDQMAGLLAGRTEITRGDRAADRWPGGRIAVHGLRPVRHRADPGEGCTHLGSGRAWLRNQLQRDGAHRAPPRRCWRRVRTSAFASTASTRSTRCGWRKSFGIWSREFTQGYTPGETGMDRWIDWQKPDFIGRDAAMKERDAGGSGRVLVTLEVDADDADASGFEPVWADGKLAGFITSGGYGHTLGKSLAMAMVDRACAGTGQQLTTHIVGAERGATVIAASPYDPQGKAMRG
jgi:dimethylglycine dehydrogenase